MTYQLAEKGVGEKFDGAMQARWCGGTRLACRWRRRPAASMREGLYCVASPGGTPGAPVAPSMVDGAGSRGHKKWVACLPSTFDVECSVFPLLFFCSRGGQPPSAIPLRRDRRRRKPSVLHHAIFLIGYSAVHPLVFQRLEPSSLTSSKVWKSGAFLVTSLCECAENRRDQSLIGRSDQSGPSLNLAI